MAITISKCTDSEVEIDLDHDDFEIEELIEFISDKYNCRFTTTAERKEIWNEVSNLLVTFKERENNYMNSNVQESLINELFEEAKQKYSYNELLERLS